MAVKRYRVTGQQTVLGHEPGKTFEADLPPEQEAPLLASGAIQEVLEGTITAKKLGGEKPKKK